MRQFGRRYQLVIGSQADGFTFNNLRINFTITKSLDKQPNPGKIRVWNLTLEHIGAILSGQYNRVALSVGYEALRLIYAGDIVKSKFSSEDGVDKVVDLVTGDGNAAFTSARVNMVLPAGTTDAQAAIALSGTMPGTARGTMAVQRTAGSTRPRVYCGNTRDALSNLAHANNADWSIQDGELIMLPANTALAGEGPLISQETGMVGSPEQSDNGLEVACLLNPEITVGGVCRVKSIIPYYSGDYKVVSVEHSGDSHEGDWHSKLICIGGTFQKVQKKKETAAADIDDGGDVEVDNGFGARAYSVDALVKGFA